MSRNESGISNHLVTHHPQRNKSRHSPGDESHHPLREELRQSQTEHGSGGSCQSTNIEGSGRGRQPQRQAAASPGPPDGGDDDGDDSDEESSHHQGRDNNGRRPPNHRPDGRHGGYSVPAVVHPRFNDPGVLEAVEHHHNQMHKRLLQLIRDHISMRLNLPDDTKV